MTTAELHTLTGAYALHALPPEERRDFERHLADCPACDQEVRELSATASRLGLAVSVAPPETMRSEVLRRIGTVRQEAPGTPERSGGRGGARTGRITRFALAACVAVAAAAGGVAVWQHQEADRAQQRAEAGEQRGEAVARVLAAPDAKARSGAIQGGATGTVVVSKKLDRAVFAASGMPKPPSGKVYQLWFNDGGTMRAAGLLNAAGEGDAVMMDGHVGVASGMGVTMEPAGGSKQPTSDPLALMEFPSA
ncbi:anti-sigma factor [Streptomyces tsukubensis]|uniref:Regulator of SigK n=1 Tax=Streptomyces tsukubensis TaxID=83656 RepID=A0A1V4AF85_9ACTN|nr:anti-sigma factor [Streptomyces tsukubensis]OON82241.1 anti-sigma factor [Streptomyces tsukubensis]QFR92732.1 anti-sigma factor [Streptomyces tsukubensis]